MLTPIQSGRLYELIVEQIENRILSGELQPGDRLPTERELAEQLNVSRTAVREAMKTLAQKGLVVVQAGRGTFVIDRTTEAVRHSLGLMLRIGLAAELADLIEVRSILEPEIAGLAALRASDDQIQEMRAAVAKMDASLDDADTFIEADNDFHLVLAEGTRNPLLLALLDSIVDLLQEQRQRIFLVSGGARRGQHHHHKILQAVEQRDADAAREAMRAHLVQVSMDSAAAPNGHGRT